MSTFPTSIVLQPGGQLIDETTLGPLQYHDMISQLNQSLGVLVIGLMLTSISFWMVCTKAVEYARRASVDGRATKATVTCLMTLNLLHFAIAVYKVYHTLVTDFGELSMLLDNDWSIPIQILTMTSIACIAQGFFTHRLYSIRQSQVINISTIFLIVTQFIMVVVSVVELFKLGYGTIMILDFGYFSIYAMFGLSASVDVALAIVIYLLQRRSGAPQNQLRYWAFESLMGCGVLSMFSAIMLGVVGLDLVWLVAVFVLGNLYTLSVLLSLTAAPPGKSLPAARTRRAARRSAQSGMSTPTLTNDMEGRRGDSVGRGPAIAMEVPSSPTTTLAVKNSDDKLEYVLGYHSGDAAV